MAAAVTETATHAVEEMGKGEAIDLDNTPRIGRVGTVVDEGDTSGGAMATKGVGTFDFGHFGNAEHERSESVEDIHQEDLDGETLAGEAHMDETHVEGTYGMQRIRHNFKEEKESTFPAPEHTARLPGIEYDDDADEAVPYSEDLDTPFHRKDVSNTYQLQSIEHELAHSQKTPEEHVDDVRTGNAEPQRQSPPLHRTHVDSTPFSTDSMVSVPLTDAHESVSTSETRQSRTSAFDIRESRRSGRLSHGFNFNEHDDDYYDDDDDAHGESSGSGYDSSSFEEAVIVEAAVATAPKAGSIRTMDDASSIAESRSAKTADETSSIAESSRTSIFSADQPRLQTNRKDMAWPHITVNEEELASPIEDETDVCGDRLSLAKTVTQIEDAVTPIDDAPSHDIRRVSATKPEISVDTDVRRSTNSSVDMSRQSVGRKGVKCSMDLNSRPTLDSMSTLDMEEALDRIEEAEEGGCSRQLSRAVSADSEDGPPVDWDKLDKTEECTAAEEEGDEQTALLFARLEQENQAIAIETKTLQNKMLQRKDRGRTLTNNLPPSVAGLKSIIESHRQSIRLSRAPSPPPMTELDFWAALVRDYPSTAQRLPTLTSNKIRQGIPPPLRGVVWVSMAGARDKMLEEKYDRLCGEQSPYENIISKDIGRSFPGVEMFRDPGGEGQKMLGRVLKCFSLHDERIGYCQGLGFLVGPLLMQTGEREAFCILVRLMEDYDLHSCFQPDLVGLHLRIYQFQELLRQHMPMLAAHLAGMQVEAVYLSQWFLSFFAVTCPLPMLFRIYDVIIAEGASETIMRVALSVMRRNEQKILRLTEFEDVMQLLLSRALWDPYGLHVRSGDELVRDFVGFTSLVTRENLLQLDASFKALQGGVKGAGFFPEVQNAAGRFLGRLWPPTPPTPKTPGSMLSPNGAGGLTTPAAGTSRPSSFLRRTPSKQSLASTHNSAEAGSGSTMSSSSAGTTLTDATSVSRVTSNDYEASVKSGKTAAESLVDVTRSGPRKGGNDPHTQIEDLLMAISEMQRDHAQLAAQLAKEREEREEDGLVVRALLDALGKEKRRGGRPSSEQGATPSKRRSTHLTTGPLNGAGSGSDMGKEGTVSAGDDKRISTLIARAEYRFPMSAPHNRRSITCETKAQLRSALAQAREHIASETSRAADLSQQLDASEQEASSRRDELRDARGRIQTEFAERQRLEKVIRELRSELKSPPPARSVASTEPPSGTADAGFMQRRSSSIAIPQPGLRELRLGRGHSSAGPGASFSKRASSLVTQAAVLASVATSVAPSPPVGQTPTLVAPAAASAVVAQSEIDPRHDALLLELVNAKTAEAVARQELDELRGRCETMRKALAGQGSGSGSANAAYHKVTPSEGWVSFVGAAAGAAGAKVAGAMAERAGHGREAEVKVEEKERSPDGAGPAAKASVGGQGWGGWGWGKRG